MPVARKKGAAITPDELRERLQHCLDEVSSASVGVETWKSFLLGFSPARRDDRHVLLTCALALRAVGLGNFGVGAVLVDGGGRLIVQGHNQIFRPHFRSDLHAEMVVLDRWEDSLPVTADGFTLYTSLEPCPMCTVRLSTSHVSRILYAAPDVTGGMASRLKDLPPFWQEFAARKTFAQADCSPELIDASSQILMLNLQELSDKVMES